MPVFDALGIVVADMSSALAFYRLLGLDLPTDDEAQGHVEAATPSGIRIMFDTEEIVKSFDGAWTRPPAGRGRMGLAFLCSEPAEVDTTHARIVEAGYRSHLDPFDAFWGQRYATVVDPDGNLVDLFAAL